VSACPYCGSPLALGPPWAPGEGHRLAYDPHKGRLWNVCPGCSRWTLTPLDQRWETLEACEEAVEREGKVRFSTPHLSLVEIKAGELVRVGEPPRSEFVDWRYGEALSEARKGPGFWARLLARLPAPPVGGYDPYRGFEGAVRSEPWLASPFLESASALTYLYSQVPFAPACPACHGPLALRPWEFQDVQILAVGGGLGVLTRCALCETEVTLDLGEARPGLRLGLSLVTPAETLRVIASVVAKGLDTAGGPHALLEFLAKTSTTVGALTLPEKAGLIVSLDEIADMEALEGEWRQAEEMAAIMDGELSEVEGFQAFREELSDGRS